MPACQYETCLKDGGVDVWCRMKRRKVSRLFIRSRDSRNLHDLDKETREFFFSSCSPPLFFLFNSLYIRLFVKVLITSPFRYDSNKCLERFFHLNITILFKARFPPTISLGAYGSTLQMMIEKIA